MTTIHFLNVGHGDWTIIEHPSGRITMIDINNGTSLDDESRREIAAGYGITGTDYETKLLAAQLYGNSFRKTYLREKGYDVDVTNPVDYYKLHWGTKPIFRYIQSHPDLDHMRGLSRLAQEGIQICNFWDTNHNKNLTEFTGNDEDEWAEYQRLRKAPTGVTTHFKTREARGQFWNNDENGGKGDGLHTHFSPYRRIKTRSQPS
jgi:beta-lactamase superfamily II metal-dependent hydrolase